MKNTRRSRMMLCSSLALVLLMTAFLALGSEAAPLAPTNLRSEYQQEALGLDTPSPRLFWQVNDTERGARQSAWQVQVASSPDRLETGEADIWDSGKVASDKSIQVEYAGPRLTSRQRCYWHVRTWNGAGQRSGWSKPAWWEMALLAADDWQAEWIGPARPPSSDPELDKWIWHPTEQGQNANIELRKSFTLPEKVVIKSAWLWLRVDNTASVWLNGQPVARYDDWRATGKFEVTQAIKAGDNLLALQALNEEGPCGFIASLVVEYDGGSLLVQTDDTWKANVDSVGEWQQPDYDDSSWLAAAILAEFGEGPWSGSDSSPQQRSIWLRKEFTIKPALKRARLYVTGLGIYEASLNGKRVGEDYFGPGWTAYGKRVQYKTYDVTELLKEGPNAFGALLGNGWWSGGLGWNSAFVYPGASMRLLAQLELTYRDGTREVVATDPSWTWAESPVLENSYYHGETYDARLEQPGWDSPGFEGTGWRPAEVASKPVGALVAEAAESIQLTRELPVQALTNPAPGIWIFDFGQNQAGFCRLCVNAPAGTRLQLRFGEELNLDGTLYTANYRSARATDVYYCKGGGEEVWQPHFTYRGFRYAELTGFEGAPDEKTLVACSVHSAVPEVGQFECSNDLINRIWLATLWGQRSNMHSVVTDCPQRDERLGWMGDGQLFAPTACWNMEMARFFSKWVTDMTDSQNSDGSVTDVAPLAVVGAGAAAPAWGDAVIIVPWSIWRMYGDTRVIKQHYEGMRGWIEYMRRNAPDYLYEREGYGDWVPVVGSPNKQIGAAYFYYSTKLFAEMAAAIGEKDDAAEYRVLAERIRVAFNAAYLDPESFNYPGGTQTANLVPLYFGLPAEEDADAVFANLVRDIRERDYHLTTGFIGTAYLLPELSARGATDVAYRLATQTTYPSWGYMLEKGATTIWERWNTDSMGPEMNSRNHFAFGTVAQWFYETLGGLNPDDSNPGFKHFLVKPQPVGDLTWAKASFQSEYGPLGCYWAREAGHLKCEVTVPANTTATVWVPLVGFSKLSEGGQPLLDGDAKVGQAAGLRFQRLESGFAVFEAGSGIYSFLATN